VLDAPDFSDRPTYLISVAAHRKFKCRVQFGMNVLACETCCPRRRCQAGPPEDRSDEPLLRAKKIAAFMLAP
jgi:hypothetical protein